MKIEFKGYRLQVSSKTGFFIRSRRDLTYFSNNINLVFIIIIKKYGSESFGKIIVITRKLL